MLENAIHNLAFDKAFARISYLQMDILKLRQDIISKNTGGITMQELTDVYVGTKKELKVWEYIAETIEKNHGKEKE
jgi:hypothetical protein